MTNKELTKHAEAMAAASQVLARATEGLIGVINEMRSNALNSGARHICMICPDVTKAQKALRAYREYKEGKDDN